MLATFPTQDFRRSSHQKHHLSLLNPHPAPCVSVCDRGNDHELTLFDQYLEPQILPHQAEARKGAEAEPSHPTVDSSEDWKYHQVSSHHNQRKLARRPSQVSSLNPGSAYRERGKIVLEVLETGARLRVMPTWVSWRRGNGNWIKDKRPRQCRGQRCCCS
ncbi:uncharacterized protein A1O5_04929 [Cladophialophora psammophila CBS 110553]|uniref:Uncharacterized protein n=1 Tax=Cladophialophora psammophila CBS 110553 TaxID=1182543 RepID=W9X549_9EURO|nr:uncharacterized protein A1O5_04929 [Cladophialophora psammophila CBS 110553]EXJ72425.1 hypothetical protein A1O5_04929 [Cladophialophora psammophila CBS 110553]